MLEKEFIVEEQHSALEMESGDLKVLSTPSMIAFMENVAKKVAAKDLEEDQTTVGIDLNVQHVKATALGQTVRVVATLLEQKKTILSYELEAFEGDSLIGKGTHKRAIVDANRFMANL